MTKRKNIQQIGIYSIISCNFGAIITQKTNTQTYIMKHIKLISLLALSLALASCEKVSLDELLSKEPPTSQPSSTGNASLSIHIGGIADANYQDATAKGTRAIEPIGNVCTKLTISLYNEEGQRVYSVNKKSTDADFADVTIKLAEGKYYLVVVAHSNEKNATTTDINKITFDGKLSDTFHYYKEIELQAGGNNIDVVMERVTAMFRLEITDEIPENVKQLKFYYTGGSSTLSGFTGAGAVNSRQTEIRNIQAGVNTYEVYTFPQSEDKKLKMTVTALDASGETICMRSFEEVPVSKNVITRYKGSFFTNITPPTAADNYKFSISANTDWKGENIIEF